MYTKQTMEFGMNNDKKKKILKSWEKMTNKEITMLEINTHNELPWQSDSMMIWF